MSAPTLGLRLVLACVFAVAGMAKLLDPAGSRRALQEFGTPEWLAEPGGWMLPVVEVAVAVGLLLTVTARWAAAASLGLLAVFMLAIVRSLAAGRQPECHCFGQLHASRAGVGTLLRNLALAGGAAVVVALGPGADAFGWAGGLSGAEGLGVAALGAAVASLGVSAFFLVAVLRQNGRLLSRIAALEQRAGLVRSAQPAEPRGLGLPVGSPAPPVELPGLDGLSHTLDELRAGRQALVVFSDPGCSPCAALLPELGDWQREHAERLAVVVVSRSDAETNRAKAEEHGLEAVLLQSGSDVARAFGAHGTPSAVLVSADGAIASSMAGGAAAIRDLLSVALSGEAASVPAAGLSIWSGPQPVTVEG